MSEGAKVEAVTFDFYNTLVFHAEGRGRGGLLVEYVADHGYQPGPWEHGILYRLFEHHGAEYAQDMTPRARRAYLERFAARAFRELGIPISRAEAAEHALALWGILGPSSLAVFPDVVPTLQALGDAGLPLAVVSNWQGGLEHFVSELGLSPYLHHVIGSSDFGVAKPDPRIFLEACRRLGTSPANVLHVGDTLEEDYLGARDAGCRAVLLQRRPEEQPESGHAIGGLDQVMGLPELSAALATGRGEDGGPGAQRAR